MTLANLRVFATHPHQCSYLEGQQATTIFIDPKATMNAGIYSELSRLGFRRSGPHYYKPHCSDCNACIPSRIPVDRFKPGRSFKRILNRNRDLVTEEITDVNSEECWVLYRDYINARHADGDMHPPSRDQYESFLSRELGVTKFIGFRLAGQLVALAVVDSIECGLAAIYTFFDPNMEQRSLGSYAILWQIEEAKRLGLPSVYLGYWIQDCSKMSYKSRFRPIELLINGSWMPVI